MDEIEINQGEVKPEAKPDAKPAKKVGPRKVWPWITLLILIVLGLTGYIGYKEVYLPKYAKKSEPVQVASDTTSTTATTTNTATSADLVVDKNVTWKTPVKLADQGLFTVNTKYEGMGGCTAINYYSVGTTSTGAEIIEAFVDCAPSDNAVYVFLKKAGKYYIVSQNSSSNIPGNPTDDPYYYNPGSYSYDPDTIFVSLKPDPSIIKGNTILVFQYNGGIASSTDVTSGTKLMDTSWGGLYLESENKALDNSDESVKIARYYIKLSDGTRAYYSVKPSFVKDDNTFDLTWSTTGGAALAFAKLPTSGCGNGIGNFPIVSKDAALTGKVAVAKSGTTDTVFHLSDASATLNKYGFSLYTGVDGHTATVAEYTSNLGLIFWTDDFGTTILFANQKYAPLTECGKPVIYLYPQKDTAVSVKVGAAIGKSEPEYNSGWNGLARANGQVVVNGTSYPYLFWEGTGLGRYPSVQSGIIVPRALASYTIITQLLAQGLNSKEIADFCDFWLPKMPDTAYVRISWLSTEEMNALAPLQISPKPDSVLRVFLDFQGLDQMETIAPQSFSKFFRTGFSVVEWGGLLKK